MSEALAAEVIRLGRLAGHTLAVAESLTGGLLTGALTGVPGSSAVVRGGVVAYAVDVKQDVLGVAADVLADHGAVSEETARAMAAAAASVLGATWGVSTTGVAGPEASEGKLPGTVHLAVHGRGADGEEVRVHRLLTLRGTRTQIRDRTVHEALALLVSAWAGGRPHGCQAGGVR